MISHIIANKKNRGKTRMQIMGEVRKEIRKAKDEGNVIKARRYMRKMVRLSSQWDKRADGKESSFV